MNYPDLSPVKKILVAKLRHHGDVLLASPVFSILKNRLPEASIDAYIYKDTYPMLEGHPAISNFLFSDKEWKKKSRAYRIISELKLLKKIRAEKYDLVINLTEGDRGAVAAKVSKSPLCVGIDPEGGGMFRKKECYSHLVKHTHLPRHTVEKQLDALRVLGIFPSIDERELVFHLEDSVEEKVLKLLADSGITSGKFILIHPVSRWLFKCWPAKHFSELITHLSKSGYQIVVTSSSDPAELKIAEEILANVPVGAAHHFGGKTSLKELGALIQLAKLVITVDSVPLHLTSVFKTPVIALFGPTSEKTWGPWQNPRSRVLTENMSCRPCFRPGCGGSGKSDCLETLSLQKVLEQVHSLIE